MGSRMRFAVLLGLTLLATCLAAEFDNFIGALILLINLRSCWPYFLGGESPCAAHCSTVSPLLRPAFMHWT